jgi:hypothetical protein
MANVRDDVAGWDCEAYGPVGREIGALCFFAADGERICDGLDDCRRVMAAERRRVFQRIQELAARGDWTAAWLAKEFTSPEQLLGGS